jgi:hypothetical protein
MSKKRILARQMARSMKELEPQQLQNAVGGVRPIMSSTSVSEISGSPRVVDRDAPDSD